MAAMLLVLLAPLVSRWLAQVTWLPLRRWRRGPRDARRACAARDEGHHDHHAMAMPHGEAAKKPPADPHADHEMGVDCDYCLIAARLITLLVAVLLLAPMARCAALRAVAGAAARISGTWERGPPAFMAA
jgi:hypothetical protein